MLKPNPWYITILGPLIVIGVIVALVLLLTDDADGVTADRPTAVKHYESPCYQRERVARDVPPPSVDRSRGLAAYVDAHLDGSTPDTELADYWAALDRCDATEPVGKWDWDALVLVSTDLID